MKNLKAKKVRSKYKSTDAWINAVYRNNKELIDTTLTGIGTASNKTKFRNLVKEYINQGAKPQRALKDLIKSTVFTPIGERMQTNAYKALKNDPEVYKAFREATKVKGRYTKVDLSKFKWDKYTHTYTYDDISVSFKNSPYQVILKKI